MKAKNSGGKDFKPTPAGIHHAVCYGVIDLGTQYSQMFDAEQRKCIILWELPEETIEIDGEQLPRAASKMYTISLNDKANLRHDLEGWRGKPFSKEELDNGFELKKLLGVNCQLNIIHFEKNDRTYANVNSIVPIKRGMKKYKNRNEFLFFSFDEEMVIPEGIPEWIMNLIMKSVEYNQRGQMNDEFEPNYPDEPPQHGDEDIPF